MEGVTSLLAETLQGTRMVKAYQLEDTEIGRTRHAFDGLYTRLVGLLTGRAKIDPILEVVGGLPWAVSLRWPVGECRTAFSRSAT